MTTRLIGLDWIGSVVSHCLPVTLFFLAGQLISKASLFHFPFKVVAGRERDPADVEPPCNIIRPKMKGRRIAKMFWHPAPCCCCCRYQIVVMDLYCERASRRVHLVVGWRPSFRSAGYRKPENRSCVWKRRLLAVFLVVVLCVIKKTCSYPLDLFTQQQQ